MNMKKIIFRYSWFVFIMIGFSCNQENEEPAISVSGIDNSLAIDWVSLELDLIKNTPGFSAPVVARALGFSGITLYESLVYGTEKYKSLEGQLEMFTELPHPDLNQSYHWGVSANAAMHFICSKLFRNSPAPELARIDSLYNHYLEKFGIETDELLLERSEEYGQAVAEYIFNWSKTDGGYGAYNDNFPADYTPPQGEGLWVPVASEKALHPYWGSNRPFLLKNRDEVDPPSPTPYSTSTDSQFHREAMEVYHAVKNAGTDEIETAFYWTDDPNVTYTPSGHCLHVFLEITREENAPLDFIAYGFAKIGMAVNDAFISCWKSKYDYNYLRPITYIQEYVDPDWLPIIITPPFPEYTSGHSVQAGAAVEVLTDLFGDHYAFTDRTHNNLELGLAPREYSSFYEFAEEAAMSRLYGGIHFMPAIIIGIDQGKKIGRNINQLSYIQ